MNQTKQTLESITIHRMLATDVEPVANLWLALIGEHATCDQTYFAAYCSNYKRKIRQLESTLREPLEQVWIARFDEEPIGYCSVYMSYVPSLFNSQIEATLGDIYIAPDHRSSGIGKLLLDQVIFWAKIREAHSLRLGVHSSNSKAIDFYVNQGFQEKFKWMMLAL